MDLETLQREFLLTIMGQFLSGESCYYSAKEDIGVLEPAVSFGKVDLKNFPVIGLASPFVSYLNATPFPIALSNLPKDILAENNIKPLLDSFAILSPLYIKGRLLGIVFLGKKISSQSYSESDATLLHSFCAVSAMTFNHARLFLNAKLSLTELQKLNDVRTDIMSRITHEFRTPLTVIKSGLSALELQDDKSEVAKWVTESVARLENLITSLLDLNEAYFDDMSMPLTDWNPLSIVHEVVSTYTLIAAERKISIETIEIPNNVLPQLKLTPAKFRKVINNLIDNAIKFSNESASVVLEFEEKPRAPVSDIDGIWLPDWNEQFEARVAEYNKMTDLELMVEPSDTPKIGPRKSDIQPPEIRQLYVVFKVTDGGIGIPASEIPLLTEPFQQASNSPDVGVKGKGLGLTVSQKILSSCGGQIYCKSKEGEGTTFTVFFPLR